MPWSLRRGYLYPTMWSVLDTSVGMSPSSRWVLPLVPSLGEPGGVCPASIGTHSCGIPAPQTQPWLPLAWLILRASLRSLLLSLAPGGSQEGDSSWGLVATVVTLSSSPPGLSCPSGGDSHSTSRRLQPASSAHPPLHPLPCHHHLPVLKPDHPHRECHTPTAGAILEGGRAQAVHGGV